MLLHPIFESQADRRPTAIAVACGAERVTYGALERGANRLAGHLRSLGAGPGSLVAILLPRSVEAYAAILAVLKAGAAYVPIEPGSPGERVRSILADCGARILITRADMADRDPGFEGTVVRVDADRSALAAQSPARPSPAAIGVGPDDLCYVIYTSGSTG